MFGHQDHEEPQQESNSNTEAVASAATAPNDDYQFSQQDATPEINPVPPASTPTITSDSDGSDQPVLNAVESAAVDEQVRDVLSPAGGYPKTPSSKIRPGGSDDSVINSLEPGNDDLAGIKQKALDELFPLIDQLDQTPEERFRTLLMMIQASDNQNLVKAVYEAAHNIVDEKIRAQALLDVVNEINYFTQQPQT
jgi:hypothetical protein